jgi:DNA-binding CsgD family transcriptional regulator
VLRLGGAEAHLPTLDRRARLVVARRAGDPLASLTKRELDVLALIAEGHPNRDIAAVLQLSEETVKTHVQHLLQKTDAKGRAHAVAIAMRSGLIG